MTDNNRYKTLISAVAIAAAALVAGLLVAPGALHASIGTAVGAEDDPASDWLRQWDGDLLELAAAASSCPNDFEPDNGWSKQRAECEFVCPPPAGKFTVHVDADDPDAQVSGTASCGVHDVHCSDRDSCESSGTYEAQADGHCRGDADEFWASGFYLNCYANAEDDPPSGGGDWCILEEPVRVCIDPDGELAGLRGLAAFGALCTTLSCGYDPGSQTFSARDPAGAPGIHIGGSGGVVVGAVCDVEGVCHLVRPTVETAGNRVTFEV